MQKLTSKIDQAKLRKAAFLNLKQANKSARLIKEPAIRIIIRYKIARALTLLKSKEAEKYLDSTLDLDLKLSLNSSKVQTLAKECARMNAEFTTDTFELFSSFDQQNLQAFIGDLKHIKSLLLELNDSDIENTQSRTQLIEILKISYMLGIETLSKKLTKRIDELQKIKSSEEIAINNIYNLGERSLCSKYLYEHIRATLVLQSKFPEDDSIDLSPEKAREIIQSFNEDESKIIAGLLKLKEIGITYTNTEKEYNNQAIFATLLNIYGLQATSEIAISAMFLEKFRSLFLTKLMPLISLQLATYEQGKDALEAIEIVQEHYETAKEKLSLNPTTFATSLINQATCQAIICLNEEKIPYTINQLIQRLAESNSLSKSTVLLQQILKE